VYIKIFQHKNLYPINPIPKTMRTLSDLDKKILAKIAPEFQGSTGPAPGHDYKFILLPVSHKLSESPEDFANRANRLTDDELIYLIDLIKKGEEDVLSLAEGDYDALLEMITKRLPEKAKELMDR
jgi:hypothetical protein